MPEESKPIYKMKVEKNVYVKMRDGIKLACDIYRPDAKGKFPALLSMSPYGKDIQRLKVPTLPRGKAEWNMIECGDTEFFVSRGYVHIINDVRGSAYSEGEFSICQPKEQEDGYDLVEWIAQRPWCNGNVGMLGISYFAAIQLLVAIQQPPHLKAIFPHDGRGDMYRDASHHGGILMFGWLPLWSTFLLGRNAMPASLKMYSKKELNLRIEKWKNNEVINKHHEFYNALLFPWHKPTLFDWLINEFDGPYYWERSPYKKYDKIKVPTYLGSQMHSYPVALQLRGAFTAWEGIKAPKKLSLGPVHVDVPYRANHDEILRWYDYWLKGIDTGIMDEPPIKIWVRGANEWKYSDEWPLPETKWTNYYLAEDKLIKQSSPSEDTAPDGFHHKPVFPLTRAKAPIDPVPDYLSYTTEPFNQDVTIIGPIALNLYASLTGEDGDFIVKLKDVSPDGSEFVLTRGWLKASHREVDKKQSKPWQPWHPHTRAVPVVPGEVTEYAIEIMPIANLFKKGHKLKLEIWGCDYPLDAVDPILQWPWRSHLSYDKEVSYQIYHSPKYPSRLLIPIIQKV